MVAKIFLNQYTSKLKINIFVELPIKYKDLKVLKKISKRIIYLMWYVIL